MIAKIKRGSGFRGALDYALNEGKKAVEGKEAELIGGNMSGTTARDLAEEFKASRELRPEVSRPVWTESLRPAEGDTLTDEQWLEVAHSHMQQIGLDPDKHMHVIVKHHDHIHIVASRIAVDASLYHGKNENLIASRDCRRIEREYGLTRVKPDMAKSKSLTKNEVEMSKRTNAEPPRERIQRVVSEAAKTAPDMDSFKKALAAEGVEYRRSGLGVSYATDGVAFKASQLGTDYNAKTIEAQIVKNRDIKLTDDLFKPVEPAQVVAPDSQQGTQPNLPPAQESKPQQVDYALVDSPTVTNVTVSPVAEPEAFSLPEAVPSVSVSSGSDPASEPVSDAPDLAPEPVVDVPVFQPEPEPPAPEPPRHTIYDRIREAAAAEQQREPEPPPLHEQDERVYEPVFRSRIAELSEEVARERLDKDWSNRQAEKAAELKQAQSQAQAAREAYEGVKSKLFVRTATVEKAKEAHDAAIERVKSAQRGVDNYRTDGAWYKEHLGKIKVNDSASIRMEAERRLTPEQREAHNKYSEIIGAKYQHNQELKQQEREKSRSIEPPSRGRSMADDFGR